MSLFPNFLLALLFLLADALPQAAMEAAPVEAAVERTLCLIKPDAVERGRVGAICEALEKEGFRIVGAKMVHLSPEEASRFYAAHQERPFFKGLVDYMSSGPLVAVVLEGKDAVAGYRRLMGPTNPKEADVGTLRRDFGINVEKNAVHGSDSQPSAAQEIEFFFQPKELYTKNLSQ